ncbi:TPA: hypothetical protein R8F93_004159 [Enterobacter soli]|uniref:Uncharacterized protein n=1 Tax=Enterobacter soli TaxID=885040 RepID=A0AAW8HCU6_9ENTR|nr:hypothetical protein [Enterobacter soli]MDQ2258804.1 hypothetical protein [Enterobacter soli]MDQ2339132.1 hypothetical protein [Enterobacter soli]HEE9790073.1 hypothetical protein [Enterobacter soli]
MVKIILSLFFLYPCIVLADCNLEANMCFQTKMGMLIQKTRVVAGDNYSHLILNDSEIFKARTDYITFEFNDSGVFMNGKHYIIKTVFSFISNDPCSFNGYYGFCSKSVVLDFSGTEPKTSNSFTPDSGNSVIDWISWGKKNAIIVFEDGSRFKYENGRVERLKKDQ